MGVIAFAINARAITVCCERDNGTHSTARTCAAAFSALLRGAAAPCDAASRVSALAAPSFTTIWFAASGAVLLTGRSPVSGPTARRALSALACAG
jgi:hypothetical protein